MGSDREIFIPNWKGGNRQLEHMAGLGRGIATAKFIHLLGEQGTAGEPLAPWRACFVVKRSFQGPELKT